MNGYELSRRFWDWSFENPQKVRPIHSAIFFFAIEHCNRLGWKENFGFPSQMVMDAIGVKNWRTYSSALNDLVDFSFIKMVEKSKNQYSSNIIAIVNFTKAQSKALDKALQKHSTKHSQSIVSITKQLNKEQINNSPSKFIEMETPNLSKYKAMMKDIDEDGKKDITLTFDGVVNIRSDQFDKLIDEYDFKDVMSKIYSLSAGIHNEDKKYTSKKDHYRTVLVWLSKDCKKKSSMKKPLISL